MVGNREPLVITVKVPGDPVAKGRPRMSMNNGGVRVYTPKKTKVYENNVKFFAMQAMRGKKPLACPVDVYIFLHVKNAAKISKRHKTASGNPVPATRPDIDNYVKAALDGINKIVFEDDCQVVGITARKIFANKKDNFQVGMTISVIPTP